MNSINTKTTSMLRNTGIDVLRGVSILFVVLLHCNIHFALGDSFIRDWLPSKIYSLLFWSGYNGVVVFFTLSGYLITLSSVRKWGALQNVKLSVFYARRAARILPLLCALLMVLAILHWSDVPGFVLNPDKVSLSQAIFSTLTFQMNWLQIQIGYLPANWDVLWSISIEESFYLVFPLLCLLVRNEKQLIALLTVFFFISPWARVAWFPNNELGDRNHLAYVDSIAFGCIVALLCERVVINKNIKRVALWLGALLLIVSFLYKGAIYRHGLTPLGLNITLLSLGVSLVLVRLHSKLNTDPGVRVSPELRQPWRVTARCRWTYAWLSYWGRYSYEIYLSHMFVVIVMAKLYKSRSFSEPQLLLLPVLLLVLTVSFGMGKVLFMFFTEPINRRIRQRLSL